MHISKTNESDLIADRHSEYYRVPDGEEDMNDQKVLEATGFFVSHGVDSLQLFRFGRSEASHNQQILYWFDPPQNAVVLDAGCGIGATAKHMKELRPDIDIVLLNISQSQLNLSPDNFKKILADYHNIPLADNSVDAVMFNYSIGYAELGKVFCEAKRILRNNGIVFINDVSKKGDGDIMESLLGYKTYYPRQMVNIAEKQGLKLHALLYPDIYDISHLTKISPEVEELFDAVLLEVTPTIFKFKKEATMKSFNFAEDAETIYEVAVSKDKDIAIPQIETMLKESFKDKTVQVINKTFDEVRK